MKQSLVLFADHARLVVKFAILALAFAQMVSAADWYVAINGTGYGTSWADATNRLQGAINKAVAGETVWVSNGVYDTELTVTPGYALTNRVVITNAITVRSANNDPTNTIIKGAGPVGNAAVRCVFLTNGASLIGFTLTNGYTGTNGDGFYDRSGGGIFLFTNAVVSNCLISGNTATNLGGGVCSSNGGILNNCTLSGNTATSGGGAYLHKNGTLNNCTLSGNTARGPSGGNWGGGVYLFSVNTLNNCTLSGNTAGYIGGGVFISSGGTLTNCTLSGNTSYGSPGGGGAYLNGTMYNCLLTGNQGYSGGGVRFGGGSLYNCTLSGNTATTASGGGVYNPTTYSGGNMVNCIIWGNNAADTSSNVYESPSGGTSYRSMFFTNTCSGPVQTGSGNIGSDPQFVNTNTGNYRLTARSPCINAGTNGSWTTSPYDLDGRTRIRYGTVDMGAYERLHKGTVCGVH